MRQQSYVRPVEQFWPSTESSIGLNHLLLAIGRAVSPPVVHMRSTFQPMRVIVVQPDLVSTMNQAEAWGCETPRLLPLQPNDDQTWHQRIVHGEILSDESGRLFEKVGRRIRPVHQLASGPAGELIEMIPSERPNLHVVSPGKTPEPATQIKQTTSTTPMEDQQGHRKLFNDPGQWRVVTWGDFKEILTSQLAHPERLSDTYRLPCYVQVVETKRDVTIEELAKELAPANGRPKPLYILTDEIAAKLELTSLLPPKPLRTTTDRQASNVLLSHERVFGLIVANDPTSDVSSFKNRKAASENTEKKPVPKTAIPKEFINEWEFKISRDEALYDMNNTNTFGLIRSLLTKLRLFKQNREFRKWQVLLTGKNSDEQLWSVRPPGNMLAHRFIRDWLQKTLESAGYDSQKMIVEWEIFWRRKGLC